MDLKRIVLGLDSSEAAAAAAHWAAAAVLDSGGEVVAVHGMGTSPEILGEAVADASRGLGFVPSEVEDVVPSEVTDTTEAVRLLLEERWCLPLREAGVAYRTVVSQADPVQALLETARREDADMIVVGHHGGTSFLDRLFRDLSDELVDHARRPVVVVPYR